MVVASNKSTIDSFSLLRPAATIDHVRAESLEFMPDGKTLVTAGFFYDGTTRKASI